tara:strand:+ start:14880 stop:14981 length:102 start_codon:yes stop_codon:yes gene_type:complete
MYERMFNYAMTLTEYIEEAHLLTEWLLDVEIDA